MTLNGVMAVTSGYFTDFGKPVFQHATASICGGIHARVYCISSYIFSLNGRVSLVKFFFTLSVNLLLVIYVLVVNRTVLTWLLTLCNCLITNFVFRGLCNAPMFF